MLDTVDLKILIWVCAWSMVGSILGFYTIRNNFKWDTRTRTIELIKSILVGLFFAIPTCIYLQEHKIVSTNLSTMFSGIVSFAVTDLIIQVWPKLIKSSGRIINKLADKLIEKI